LLPSEKINLRGREDVMGMKTVLGSVSIMLAGMTLTGCQTSDSGSGSRMLSRQSDNPYARPPMNSYASTMPGNKSLAISDTNTRPGMLPGATGVQQASAMPSTTGSSAAMPVSNSSSATSGFDQAGAVVSKPMGDVSSPPSGPTPPSPPATSSGYTIPAPTAYSPSPATTNVPTRKPGDDQ
jgi:hypothetical protein